MFRGFEVLAGDLLRDYVRNYLQMERIFEKNRFDYVYHLAAEYGRGSV
jgi:dTDP-glucose 4,6-dehydratase